MPAADIPLIDDDTIDDRVWKSDLPAVIDFWGPDSEDYCNKEKVLAAVADRYAGRVYVYRVDMRHGEAAAAWAGMRAFPVLVASRERRRFSKRRSPSCGRRNWSA